MGKCRDGSKHPPTWKRYTAPDISSAKAGNAGPQCFLSFYILYLLNSVKNKTILSIRALSFRCCPAAQILLCPVPRSLRRWFEPARCCGTKNFKAPCYVWVRWFPPKPALLAGKGVTSFLYWGNLVFVKVWAYSKRKVLFWGLFAGLHFCCGHPSWWSIPLIHYSWRLPFLVFSRANILMDKQLPYSKACTCVLRVAHKLGEVPE